MGSRVPVFQRAGREPTVTPVRSVTLRRTECRLSRAVPADVDVQTVERWPSGCIKSWSNSAEISAILFEFGGITATFSASWKYFPETHRKPPPESGDARRRAATTEARTTPVLASVAFPGLSRVGRLRVGCGGDQLGWIDRTLSWNWPSGSGSA